MESLLKASLKCDHCPHGTHLTFKDSTLYPCSVDGKYVVALSSDIIILHMNEELLFLDLKNGKTIKFTNFRRGVTIPVGRVARDTFLSISNMDYRYGYYLKFYMPSGREETLGDIATVKAISAFSVASPNKFVFCTGNAYFGSIYFSGLISKEIRQKVTLFKAVNLIAANDDLTAISSKGSSTVEFWKDKTVPLKTVYHPDTIHGLGRSKCWIFVEGKRSVIFFLIPYLDQTRMISLHDVIPFSCTERWTVNITPDETFAVIHYGKKLLLYHILSAALIGEQDLPENPLDVCILPAGELLVVLKTSICVVCPEMLCLAQRLHKLKKENIWGASDEHQRALVRILKKGECAFQYCNSRDNNFSLIHTLDEFIALYHVLVIAFEELQENEQEDLMETLSSSNIVSKLQEAHQDIRKRSKLHHLLVDEYMRELSEYKVDTVDDLDQKLTYSYDESEDICTLRNTDIFNLYERKCNKEGFVTNFRKLYQLYLKWKTRTSLAAVAIEIISFTEIYLIDYQGDFDCATSSATVQDFSNYLLGLQESTVEEKLPTLTSRLFNSTAAAISFVDVGPFDMRYKIIWTETLHDIDLDIDDLNNLFRKNCGII